MKSVLISEMSWLEFREAMAMNDMIILPVGSQEEHGPHNPLGTDAILAETMALKIGQRTNTPVAPILPIGCTHNLAAFPGTINVDVNLFRTVVVEICESYIAHGAKRFLIVNGHGGNANALTFACADLHARHENVIAIHSEWWKILPTMSDFPCNDHGGKFETSAVLAVDETMVDMSKAKTVLRKNLTEQLTYVDKFRFGKVTIPNCGITLDKLTDYGNYGAPAEEASKELGEAMTEAYVDYCAQLVAELKRVYL